MKKHIRSVAVMVMVVILMSCFMTVSASATYDVPEATTNQAKAVGWTLYIGGVPYDIETGTYVGWGNSGRAVYIVQIACNELAATRYINCSCGDADGVYGDNANRGVKGFQSHCNIYGIYGRNELVDGVVGPVTWDRFAYYLG